MKSAKIWIDDIREPPSDGWWICRSVIAAKTTIRTLEEKDYIIEVISRKSKNNPILIGEVFLFTFIP